MTFEELNENKSHYLDMMIRGDDSILYQYGPMLCATTNITVIRKYINDSKEMNLILYMLCNGLIYKLSKDTRLCDISSSIREILKKISNIPETRYSKLLNSKCIQILDTLHDMKVQDRLLESAIVSYCPITQYNGFVSKPINEKVEIPNTTKNDILNIIKSCIDDTSNIFKAMNSILETNISDIIMLNNKYITNMTQLYGLVITANKNIADFYFCLSYIYYNIGFEKYNLVIDVIETLLKTNTSFNESVALDVDLLMEAFMKI